MTENRHTQFTDEENPAAAGEEAPAEAANAEVADAEAAADETGGPETETTTEIANRLAAAEEALAAEKDRFVRLYAEFENYKKRSAREIQEYRKYANETLIREILPIIDNLERALQSSDAVPQDAGCIIQGVDMTLREIMRVLEKFNVRPVKSIGEPFDPNFHEAVGKEPSGEHPEGNVVKEYQRGYLLHDRLVRPAMVVVSAGGPAESAGSDAEEGAPESDSGSEEDAE
ncbi:MAG: nucleotide exchange factor GrpE [Desulfococcaceae bacterium]